MVRAGGVQRTLTIAEVANALRACFTGADLLRCAEIQIQLGIVLDAALAASGTHMGHIARRAGELAGLRIVAERGLDIRYIERMDPIPPREHTAPGRTLITGERSLIDDVLADERCAPQHDLARAFGYRGEHALPLIIGAGRIEGTLVTLHPEPLGHDTGRVGALDRYAREAAALVAAFP
jgi:hypothetical protein